MKDILKAIGGSMVKFLHFTHFQICEYATYGGSGTFYEKSRKKKITNLVARKLVRREFGELRENQYDEKQYERKLVRREN